MTRERFIILMENIQNKYEKMYERWKTLHNFGIDIEDAFDFLTELLDEIEYEILSTNEDKWLEYFMFDLNCNLSKGFSTIDGKSYHFNNWGDVYDFLNDLKGKC